MAVYDPLGLEVAPRKPVTLTPSGELADAVEASRELIDAALLEVTDRMIAFALGRPGAMPMTSQELRAAEILLNKRLPAAATQVNVAQTIEVRDKRREIDAMVEALLSPGAVQRSPTGAPLLNLPAVVSEARTARPDGAGPPEHYRDDTADPV
jgi:hypothetical protein